MDSMVTVVNNMVLYTWNLLRVDLNCSHHTHTHKELPKCEVMDMNLIIISQCKCISNHHIVHFKYIQVYLLIFLSKTGNK